MSHRPDIDTNNCTAITEACPLVATIYGYRPNLGVNAFFVAIFALFAIAQLGVGIRWKTYFFAGAMTLGCIAEAIGYGGRVMLNDNPWHDIGFSVQISCLIFAPAFFAGAIYLTLKHIVLTFGASKSRIPAYLYTWIFISCDGISLLLQAAGGGIAASANGDKKQLDLGTNLMISGIVFQVVVLVAFASLVIDYVVRTRRDMSQVPEEVKIFASTRKFKSFALALGISFFGIFARSVYRIAEMAEGWAKPIMRHESSFIVMEGFMIVISVTALTLCHPGYCFPQMSNQKQRKDISAESSAESGLEMEGK